MNPVNDPPPGGRNVLRTPDECFKGLIAYPFKPHYAEVSGLRMHYVDENPGSSRVVVMLHGEPTWSYLWRHMIPHFTAAGYRVIAPDIPGFGKSDKPVDKNAYTYGGMVEWVRELLFDRLQLRDIHLVVHDWGGLIGLRLVAFHPECFASVVAMNTDLPRAQGFKPAFLLWKIFAPLISLVPYSRLVPLGIHRRPDKKEMLGYDAPFPSKAYKTAPLAVVNSVPVFPWQKESAINRQAWQKLKNFDKPFLTLFGSTDQLTRGIEKQMIKFIRGAKNQPHQRIKGVSHFIQEDIPEEASTSILRFFATIN